MLSETVPLTAVHGPSRDSLNVFGTLLAMVLAAAPGCSLLTVQPPIDGVELPLQPPSALIARLQHGSWLLNPDWTPDGQWQARQDGRLWHETARWTYRAENAADVVDEVQDVVVGDSSPGPSRTDATAGPDSGESDSVIANDSHSTRANSEPPPQSGALSESQSIRSTKFEGSEPELSIGPWPMTLSRLLKTLDARQNETPGDHAAGKISTADDVLIALAERNNLAGWNAAILRARRNPAGAAEIAHVLQRLVEQPPKYDPQTKQAVDEESTLEPERTAGLFTAIEIVNRGLQKRAGNDKEDSSGGEPKSSGRRISVSMQAAAAEAWCLVLGHISADKADALGPAGRLLQRSDLPLEVRAELFRGVGRWVSPTVIPHLADALRDAESDERAPEAIRRAAIESCLMHALWNLDWKNPSVRTAELRPFDASRWPVTIWSCQFDPDPHVRLAFGHWLAMVQHPDALRMLKSQLLDSAPKVREAALISLGFLATERAKLELEKQAGRPEERVRAFAVKGLARWGPRELRPYLNDESHYVRRTAAVELGRFPKVDSALLLRDLVVDSNLQVQLAVIESIADWPNPLAVPLLLEGMKDGARATRQLCFIQLRDRTGIQEPFPLEGARPDRIAAVHQLVREYRLSSGYLDELRRSGLQTKAKIDDRRHLEVDAALKQLAHTPPDSPAFPAAVERVRQLSEADLPLVERYLRDHPDAQLEILFRDILPPLNPAYQALVELHDDNVASRRAAAKSLAEIGRSASLNPLLLHRFAEHLADEQDELVWRYALSAVMNDNGEESEYIALLAINHTWPDIRILGCRYVARHGSPQHARALMPLLSDSNKRVQLAAVEAVGRCRNPVVLDDLPGEDGQPDTRGLRSLMTDADRQVRFAVAASMSRLGDPHGMQELVRLSSDPNAATREHAVREMGATDRTRFVEHLIRLAWTESNNDVNRAILDSLERLVPDVRRPVGLSDENGYDAKIKLWVDWWEHQRSDRLVTLPSTGRAEAAPSAR